MIGLVGGTVWGPAGPERADVWVEGGTVVAVGTPPGPADDIRDVSGMLVGPGFVDLHTHLRDPGQTWKEDLASGTAAAAAGGFTAVVAMPNTLPATDTVETVEEVRSRAATVARALVAPAAALTLGREGKVPVDLEALWGAGVRVFTDDGDWVADDGVAEELMSRAARFPGAVIAQHSEDPALSGGGHMHEGDVSRRHGVRGIPAEAETEAVARDLDLALRTGAALHVQHVSAARTVELVAEARERGARVTMEVTPHHLDFTVDDLDGLDPNLKMYPPLREASDREALRRALLAGVIDVVATDHAPHQPQEKEVPFEESARGVIGLETAASVVWALAGDPDLLFEVLSRRPARIAGLDRHGGPLVPGSPANLVVFDPERRWVPARFASRSRNSPYRGRSMRGVVVMTMWEGRVTFEEAAA